MIFSIFQKNRFLGILGPPSYGIDATIRIGREMLCFPYAGFLLLQGQTGTNFSPHLCYHKFLICLLICLAIKRTIIESVPFYCAKLVLESHLMSTIKMLQLSSSHLYTNVKTWPKVFVSLILMY